MKQHTVKTIASGEYSCSCGAIWDRDEGDQCPDSRPVDATADDSQELPELLPYPQLNDETFALNQWWFKELTAVAATADQRRALAVVSNLAHRYGATRLQAEKAGHLIEQMAQALGTNDEYGDFQAEIESAEEFAAELILGNSPTGCTFCGSDEHMTAVCPMRAGGAETFKVVGYLSHCADGYDPDAPPPLPQEPLMTVAQHLRIMAATLLAKP